MLAEGCWREVPGRRFCDWVYPRVSRPFFARHPLLEIGANVTRNLRRFCASSTRWVRRRLDGESRFCIAANFFSGARVTEVSSSNDRRSGEISGFCRNLVQIAIWRGNIDFRSRSSIYIFFFPSLRCTRCMCMSHTHTHTHTYRTQVRAIVCASRSTSWSSFEEKATKYFLPLALILQYMF